MPKKLITKYRLEANIGAESELRGMEEKEMSYIKRMKDIWKNTNVQISGTSVVQRLREKILLE